MNDSLRPLHLRIVLFVSHEGVILRHSLLGLCLLMAFLLVSVDSWAVTKTSVANGNWSAAATWSPSGVPTSTDDVIINTNVVLDVNITLDAGGSITVNSGKSLIGSTAIINTNGTVAGPNISIVNSGTLTIDQIQSTEECGLVSIDNYGLLSALGIATITFRWSASGSITNYASGTISVPNSMFRLSNQTYASAPCTNPRPTLDNYGTISVWDLQFHANSQGFNRAGGVITTITGGPGIYMAAYDFDNYGCIIGNSPIELASKVNNNGHTQTTLHDGSKLSVPGSLLKITSSNHVLTGVDDDGNNANNACVWSSQNITTTGTITGELFLNDPDGAVTGGTIGPLVVLGTSNCGYTAAQPCGCPNPNCGTATIQKN